MFQIFSFQGLRSGRGGGLAGVLREGAGGHFLSQGHEVHSLQERQGEEEQQEPRSVLDQEAEAGTLLQFVCEDGE